MKQLIRLALFPVALVLFIIGFITGKLLFFGVIGGALIIFASLFYSGRKQRIRYWIQRYKTHLENNKENKVTAIQSIQQEFCVSKYADEHICNNKYEDVDSLIQDIIKKEFKFDRLVQSPISSPNNIQKNILAYKKATGKIKQEITDIKKEIFG